MLRFVSAAAMLLTAALGQTTRCPEGTTPNSRGGCDSICPSFYYNGMCVDECPAEAPLRDYPACLAKCPPGTVTYPPYCAIGCPEGMMELNGFCVSPSQSVCEQKIAGSSLRAYSLSGIQYNNCDCPANSWIVRNRASNTTLRMCAPIPTAISERGAVPPVACGTFVRNTFYNWATQMCQCAPTHPVVFPNITDTQIPYACAPPDTPTPISACGASEYFSFMTGVCVYKDIRGTPSFTPRPQTSSAADTTTAPPQLPSPDVPVSAVSPSPFPFASLFPRLPTFTFSIPPLPTRPTLPPLPSGLVWSDILSRLPLPSAVPTIFRPARVSPLPPPWRPARNITIPAERRPAYIASRLRFMGGNATAFEQPERIQQIQAVLACTLRVALEKVRITNITLTNASGRRSVIDATRYYLSSNGIVGCVMFGNATQQNSLRRLQAMATSGTADVDYYILEPTDDILSLDPADFSTVVQTSASVTELSQSMGSVGIAALSESSIAAMENSAQTQQSSGAGGSINVGLAAGVGIMGAVVLAAIGVAAWMYNTHKNKQRRLSSITHTQPDYISNTQNPIIRVTM